MDNKLNLMVNFMGVDKLSGSMKNIMMTSKSGGDALKGMAIESHKLKKELALVRKEIAAGTGNMTQLINREKQLEAATADANTKLDAQANRLKNIRKIESRAGAVSAGAGRAGAAMSIGITAPAMMFGQASMQAYLEAQDAAGQVEASLASMGRQSEFTSAQLALMARSEMKKSLYDDDQILRDLTSTMLTFGDVQGAEFGRAQAAAIDLSVKFKKDLAGSSVMVGKALQDPIKGVTALTKVGVSFSAAQKTMIKSMVAAGDKAGAQRLILAELEKQVAGSGEAARKANPGAVAKQDMDDLQETVGGKLLPIWMKFLGMVGNLADKFNTASPAMQNFVVYAGIGVAVLGPLLLGISGLAAGVGMLAGPLSSIATGARVLLPLLMGLSLPVLAIGAAVAGAAYLIYSYWTPISGFFQRTWTSIVGFFTSNWATIRNVLLGAFVMFFPLAAAGVWIAKKLYDNWGTIKTGVMGVVNYVGGIVAPFIAPFITIGTYLGGLAGKFLGYGVNMIQGLINGIVSMAGSVITAIWNLAANVGSSFAKALDIQSPSRLFMQYGGFVSEGAAMGIDKGARKAIGAAGRLATGVAAAGALSAMPVAAAPIQRANTAQLNGNAVSAAQTPITINVYGAEGQDVTALAEQVQKAIERAKKSRANGGYYDE